MKRYLLLFLGTLLLFALSQAGGRVDGFACVEQHELRAAENADEPFVRRKCAKKCLRHQTHSEQRNGGITDCSQQSYAVITEHKPAAPFYSGVSQPATLPANKTHQAPSLEADPDPPRFS